MKEKITLILIILSLFACSSESDINDPKEQFCGIYTGNVTLKTMIELEEFAKCNYTEITGGLSIYDGNVQTPITSLNLLSSLRKIGFGLSLNNLSALTTLNGLHNIESAPLLTIKNTEKLQNLDAIDKLQANHIEIQNNLSLNNINALDMLADEMIAITLYDNPELVNLNGFSNIRSLRSGLTIINNDKLIDLSGLNNLETIGLFSGSGLSGTVFIEGNDALSTFNGLNNLKHVQGNMWVINNTSLVNVNGLSKFEKLDGNLTIRYNTNLNNLDGFKSLISLKGNIEIYDNPLLRRFCGFQNLFLADAHTGSYVVSNNLFNPSKSQILNAPPCD